MIQRVARAAVTVNGDVTGAIESGLLLLVGIAPDDSDVEVDRAVSKIIGLRIFPDEHGRMNRSILDVTGSALVVSQFTLLADLRRGRRPSFTGAAPPEAAESLIGRLVSALQAAGVPTATGAFGEHMVVELVNDGPVTVVLEVEGGQVI